MLKKLLAICLGLLLVVPTVSSCAAADAAATSLVPGTANAVVQIQVAKIINNPAVRVAYDEFARAKPEWPQTAADALNQLLVETSFDLTGVSTAVFFADIESAGKTGDSYAGMITDGAFNESALIAKMQKQQTLTTSDYKGFTVYSGAHDNVEIAFFGPGRLVLGTAQAVRDAIDVSKGDQKPLGGRIIDTLDRFGPVLIAGAFTLPENLTDRSGEGGLPGQTPLSLDAFKDIDTIGFAVDLPALTLNIRLDAHFANAASIQDARDAIGGLISVAKATSRDPNVKTALGNIHVTAADSWLSLRGATGLAEISTLIGSMQARP